jgi:hypothetical protein
MGNISYNLSDDNSIKRIEFIMNKLIESYDDQLQLEVQPINEDQSHYFLETIIRNHNKYISIEPYRKNWNMIQQHSQQSIFTIQHNSSYSSRRSKIAVIIATVYRIERNSMTYQSLVYAIQQLNVELCLLGYTVSCLKQALHHIFQKSKDKKWIQIINQI